MLIAQLSDTHISAPGHKTCGVADMAANLRRCVDSINNQDPRPDLVLLSGDVTHSATRIETEHAAEILSALEVPLFVVPGNHDDRKILAEVFGPMRCPTTQTGFMDYVIEGYPLRIIGLDTLNTGQHSGQISPERLDWLKEQLHTKSDLPVVLFAHHPPLKLGVPETDQEEFCGAAHLGELVAAHPNIERFLCGHIHLHTNTGWHGTIVTTCPSIGMQLTLDLKQRNPSQFLLSEPAYLLHHWTADEVLITHPIQLSEMDGPFDFTS
ncbi:phosphodiesterase [Sulfitobacter donghicola]|uniref:Metallophosphatase n=1 Tax=Sulfitobacter donghicola DSW-25 = KCTC 12864 = JCM 14565 TaxID=1300350 RepID=A0A073IJ64_9RHOB|nr:phosphodiesterase [Sulfitobacter donghicola]KEJ89819.1 metallophosphatase [Sulfitobacter donghicola DSW-25 = KCTC 12864 = JCM 14565]KIN67061.1 3',5'-cyclic adenosine monophosphate phosphodiesterase CpdA [Sulfitobacter donghicola DSW-25 = KCTC 12864 = JCM 14565]